MTLTPVEIAALMTPDQAWALAYPNWCKESAFLGLARFEGRIGADLITSHKWLPVFVRTPLGRAVLAEIDRSNE